MAASIATVSGGQHGLSPVLTQIGAYGVAEFMQKFWQREAYLARQAFPAFQPSLDADALLKLATREDVESRLIIREDETQWNVEFGPFPARTWKKLPAKGWTVLVQGVNLWEPSAAALLRQFAFVPYARLDDLMVSYAVDGGGVGPHFDSYDVFLLQASGQRQWSVAAQQDLSLVPDMPLKILSNFKAEQSWVLDAGDMLYLPPRYAHDGVAVGECMTYSIGFRAPSHREWSQGFLNFWHDELEIDGLYQDVGLVPTSYPAEIPVDISSHVSQVIQAMLWGKKDIHRFVGVYLTEPKETVFFNPPSKPWTEKKFKEHVLNSGLSFAPESQALYDNIAFYCNGEVYPYADFSEAVQGVLRELGNVRGLTASSFAALSSGDQAVLVESLLYEGYRRGYWS